MPDFGASFQQPSLDAEASEGCLVLTRRVIRVHGSRYRVRTACLGTSVPSSPVLILHNVTTYCSCNQPLNPKTISRLPLHSGDPPMEGSGRRPWATAQGRGQSGGPQGRRQPGGGALGPWWSWRERSTSPSVAFLLQTIPGAVSLVAGAAVTRSEDPLAPNTTPAPVRRASSRKSLGWTPSGTRDKSRHKPPTPWRKKKPDTRAIGSSKET